MGEEPSQSNFDWFSDTDAGADDGDGSVAGGDGDGGDSDLADADVDVGVDASGSNDEDDGTESVGGDDADPLPDASAVDPATPTYRWTPEGAACESCGCVVERRWVDGDGADDHDAPAFVCDDCKEW